MGFKKARVMSEGRFYIVGKSFIIVGIEKYAYYNSTPTYYIGSSEDYIVC